MKNDEHISLVELINFSKGIYGIPGDEIDKKNAYERIVMHLGNCPECMQKLLDLDYVSSNFDDVWETLFPSVMEPASSKVASESIFKWLSDVRVTLNTEAKLIIDHIQSILREGTEILTPRLIPATITTHGVSIIDEKTLYFINPEDEKLFDRIEMKDNTLVFHSSAATGYRQLILIGPDKVYKKADIIEMGPTDYYAKFQAIILAADSYLVYLPG